jgi:ureidoglycolate hydrolase
MTKFAGQLTDRVSQITGLDACRAAAATGALKKYSLQILSADLSAVPGLWRRVSIDEFEMSSAPDALSGPLVAEGLSIQPRDLVLEELTRHEQTAQAFLPCDGPFLVVAVANLPGPRDLPDPTQVHVVPCRPGEVVILEKGVWHTLPFPIEGAVKGLTVVHRLPPGDYHDVRDLPAEGWFGEIAR